MLPTRRRPRYKLAACKATLAGLVVARNSPVANVAVPGTELTTNQKPEAYTDVKPLAGGGPIPAGNTLVSTHTGEDGVEVDVFINEEGIPSIKRSTYPDAGWWTST